ncbi:hypothetical protein ACFXG4_48410 [Nocardia sp. NPDC059246]|uniref:hypothetical protein n=1 Tax=unclassified Nocardia TaxID=2637762 RepID=UPI00368EDE0D
MLLVVVARRPDVFVEAVTPEEGRKLAQIVRRSSRPVWMRRAVVVMASAQHQPVGFIAKLMRVSESCVRQVIHDLANSVEPSSGWPECGERWCSCWGEWFCVPPCIEAVEVESGGGR